MITKNTELLSISKDVAIYFSFRAEFIESTSSLDSATKTSSAPLMILMGFEPNTSFEEKCNVFAEIRASFPRSQIVVALSEGESVADAADLKLADIHHVLSMKEITSTAKLYYISALIVHGTYLPVPVNDLFPSTQLNFNAYQKLALNQKFLPVIFSGFNFTDKKYRKLEPAKQVYIRREDLKEYQKYIEMYHDVRGAALKKRCRAILMNIMVYYTEILLLLTADAEAFQSEVVQEKISLFQNAASELCKYLKDCPDVWNMIAQSLDFKFCRLERGPYVMAYALALCLKAEMGKAEDIAMTVLLADLTLLQLPAEAFKSFHTNGEEKLEPQHLENFKNHPASSLELALFRQLTLSEEVKSIIVATHEQGENIPIEAKLISFCEILDRRVRAQLEEGRVTHDFIRRQVWEEEKVALNRFNDDFLDKIEKVLVAKPPMS